MPKIGAWNDFPLALREHLIERMHSRSVSLDDLNRLRLWVESDPEVPDGQWYKDFGSFKVCGDGPYPIPTDFNPPTNAFISRNTSASCDRNT